MHVNSNIGSLSLTRDGGGKAIGGEEPGQTRLAEEPQMCLLLGRVTENANQSWVSFRQRVDTAIFLNFKGDLCVVLEKKLKLRI